MEEASIRAASNCCSPTCASDQTIPKTQPIGRSGKFLQALLFQQLLPGTALTSLLQAQLGKILLLTCGPPGLWPYLMRGPNRSLPHELLAAIAPSGPRGIGTKRPPSGSPLPKLFSASCDTNSFSSAE